ncbi:MAG: DUF2892 domain-containing protein [Fimbriimonadales bacterium]|nr:DUF2892 domain-containing protein [Fimbriimonadales bacterium]
MTCNIGRVEQAIRILIGIAILAAGWYYQSWWGLIGLIPLLTGIVRFCPLWRVLGISSCPASERSGG